MRHLTDQLLRGRVVQVNPSISFRVLEFSIDEVLDTGSSGRQGSTLNLRLQDNVASRS